MKDSQVQRDSGMIMLGGGLTFSQVLMGNTVITPIDNTNTVRILASGRQGTTATAKPLLKSLLSYTNLECLNYICLG